MFLKYCGFTRKEDVDFAVSLGVDALGFIFYEKSKRYVSAETVKKISSDVPTSILKVGVFVQASVESINATVAKAGLDRVQIFAEEIEEDTKYSVPVIPAYRIKDGSDFGKLPSRESFLLDAFSSVAAGGTGESFDWNLLAELSSVDRAIIAGGVDESNLVELLAKVRPYGIDLSSGIEESKGLKSHEKMKSFKDKLEELLHEQ